MFSPAKAITAGALVFAIGGVLLIAQPFDQRGSSVPGAATDGTQGPEYLLILSAPSGSIEAGTLLLDGAPSVIQVSDRPAEMAGQMGIESLVRGWDAGDASFASDPPDAVLSLLDADGADSIVRLRLTSLARWRSIDADTLQFGFEVTEGSLPEGDIGPVALFIDHVSTDNPALWCGRSDPICGLRPE